MSNVNVDPQEIEKFSALAARWWDKDSEFKPLHDINPLRLNYIDGFAHINGKNVLDVGCGGGILSESMAERGATVTGIDMADASLQVAKLHALESQANVTYEKLPVEDLARDKPESFDVVTCMEMLEHVPDPASIIQACTDLVKPGGWVFFSTINRTPKAYLFAIIGAEYVLNLLPRGTHDYKAFIKPSELAAGARQAELLLKDSIGMHYSPFTKTYSLGAGLDVNYIMAFQKPD